MPKLILTTACATAVLSLVACKQETTEANITMNAEETNYADTMADMNDMNEMNMTDMNMGNAVENATENATGNATGNEAIDNSSGY